MKFLLAPLLIILSSISYAGDTYLGFQWGFMSRGGLIWGVHLDEQNSIELHLNGLGHYASYGVSLKHQYDDHNYVIAGYTGVSWSNLVEESDLLYHGFNLGIGHDGGSKESGDWSYPLEIGGGAGYERNKDQWVPLFFFGYGLIYNY